MKKVVEFRERSVIDAETMSWLARLDREDELSSEERERLKEWSARSPLHRETMRRFAKMWEQVNVLTELAVPLARPRKTVWDIAEYWGLPRLARLAVASVVLIAVSIVVWNARNPMIDTNGFYATEIGEQESTTLSDGSVVLLNTNTKIKVDYDSGFRDIYLLNGEAHFTVAENELQLFRVFAGSGRIDAVGTAFSVHLKDEIVDVVVTEGRVALASIATPTTVQTNSAGGVAEIPDVDKWVNDLGTLHAGQVASIKIFTASRSNAVEALDNLRDVDRSNMSKRLAWTEGVLLFSGEPLSEVVKEISRYTTVNIEFSNPEVGAIRIGGIFPVGETDTMFEALETAFGLRVKRLSDDRILISAGI